MSWKVTLDCSRADAEAMAGDVPELADLEPVPVFVASERDESALDKSGPDDWRLDVYFEGKPSRDVVRRITRLVPSANERNPRARPVEDADWVSLSQAGFEPLIAGRFHVRTPDHPARADLVDFVIPAGLAFGTGQHATTAGCLRMLDSLKRRGRRYREILDLGTGTGLLAFGAARLWPSARVVASDIDPVSIAVVAENAALNRVARLKLVVADGLVHRDLVRRAPYDLVIANILAQPLIDMAPSIAAALAPGATLLLAGLLDTQADAVARAYRRQGLRLAESSGGQWPVLRLVGR